MEQTVPPFKPRVRHIGRFRYLVESKSQPGLGRQVDTLKMKCSCPAGKYERRCRHIVLALQLEDWRRKQGLEP